MSRESMRGESQEKIIYKLTRDIVKNMAFLDAEDIKVLEFLSKKGDFNAYKAKLVKTGEHEQ